MTNFSLYSDHVCAQTEFPSVMTTILDAHKDEVWVAVWSHDGRYLATGGKDKSVIVWRVGVSAFSSHLVFPLLTFGSVKGRDTLRGLVTTAGAE
jgi:WD40 repeat protein